jgi:hypothetical protein
MSDNAEEVDSMSTPRSTPPGLATDEFGQARMLRSHIERCLQDIWETHEIITDSDGDFPFRHNSAMCWVTPVGGPLPGVRVMAHAAIGVKRTAKLLAELNDFTANSRFCQVYWHAGVVYVSCDLTSGAIDRHCLNEIMREVAGVAAYLGPMIATVFGASTPFPSETDEPSHNNGEVA